MNVYSITLKISNTERKLTEIKEDSSAKLIDLVESLAQYILKVSLENSTLGGEANA